MQSRPATTEEILQHHERHLRHGWTVRFRHFVKEIPCRHAQYGVSHVQHRRAKLRVIDGKPHVRHHGEIVEVTGELVTLDTGTQFVADLRIKSEYLPKNIL